MIAADLGRTSRWVRKWVARQEEASHEQTWASSRSRAREDPSWAPSHIDQSFPVDIRDALAPPPGRPAVERGPFIERDLGPDLGMGL